MIVDSSALLSVLLGESSRRTMTKALEDASEPLRLSAVNFVETSVVIETRKGAAGLIALDRFIEKSGIEISPIDAGLAREARAAYSKFGKGRHPAKLNLGDCFTYALARHMGEAILCTGNDFSKTDIPIVG